MAHLVVGLPDPSEYAPYYAAYVSQVETPDLLAELEQQRQAAVARLSRLSEEQSLYRYAPEKWSVKDALGHVIDAERVFTYRALRISRNDPTPLASFNQDTYVRFAPYPRIPFAEVVKEFDCVRHATLYLFRGLEEAAWARHGTASNALVTVRALGYIAAGHAAHHLRILAERYGIAA